MKPPERLCYFCNHKSAVKLCSSFGRNDQAVFCSEGCASMYAVEQIIKSRTTWCNEHSMWSDSKGRCHACDLFKKGCAASLIPNAAARSPVGEEVNHE